MSKTLIYSVSLLLAVFTVFTFAAVTEGADVLSAAGGWRINVETNKEIYHHKDVLQLTVELLNDGIVPVRFLSNEEPPRQDSDTGEITLGRLGDEDVVVDVNPETTQVIGYAVLIPMSRSDPRQTGDAPAPEPKKVRLPLFAGQVVPGHSTRIVSIANILIAYPNPDGDGQDDPGQGGDPNREVDVVKAETKFTAMKPGYYLLQCNVDKVVDSRPCVAQKVIQIRRPKPDQTAILIKQTGRTVEKIDKRTENIAKATQNISTTVLASKNYLRTILQLLTSRSQDQTTNTTTIQTRTVNPAPAPRTR